MIEKTLFYFYGQGGSGKNTIVNKLMDYYKDNPDFELIVPVTTRKQRNGEVNGVDYIFTDEKDFNFLLNNHKLISFETYTVYNENNEVIQTYYGYPYPTKKYSILIGNLKTLYILYTGKNKNLHLEKFFITCSSQDLLYRMITRELSHENPNIKEVCRRFVADLNDFGNDSNNLYRDIILPSTHPDTYFNEDIDHTLERVKDRIDNVMSGA